MSDNTEKFTFDSSNLYREETYTDQRTGAIRCMIPVDIDGNDDPQRSVQYHGQTQVLTPAGALPINFELEAGSLAEAAAGFAEAAEQALEKTMQELQEMRRQQSSSIMVPGGQGGSGMGGGGNVPGTGGMGGGGLQMP